MKKEIKKYVKKFLSTGIFLPVVVSIGLCIYLMVDTSGALDEGEVKIVTSSSLMEAIDVSELATSEFIYNGIAEVYTNEKKEKVEYYIRYDARIRAGIDIQDVGFDINEEEKVIIVTLPVVEIFIPPTIDSESLSYIPSEKEYDLKEVLETCEADVITEAEAATELKSTATENLKAIIEALLVPIVEPEGYEIIWADEKVEE